jgi:hypothetical protein
LCALSTRPSPITVVPALLLVVLSLWEVCATPRSSASTPTDRAWAKVVKLVRAEHKPGDLIVFAPDWIDPVGRLHLGDLIPLEMAARMDAARYGRIWELSIGGSRSPDTRGLAPVASQTIDGITVRRFERTPATIVADIRVRLANMRVDSGPRPLLELTEVGFTPRRCLQVTPAPGQPARITFPQMPLGTTLVGYVGLADVFTRRDIRAPGTLAVDIDGRTVATVSAGVDDGWVRFEIATTPGRADVSFVASATTPQRLICFAAEARR